MASMSSWFPLSIPSSTTLTSINPTHASNLVRSLSSATLVAATATREGDLYSLSQVIRGAQASLSVISAEKVIATATADQPQSMATQQVFNSTLNLQSLEWSQNLYSMNLNMAANIIFTVLFLLAFIFHIILFLRSKQFYFGIAMFCGTGLEWAGYLSRALSVNDLTNEDKFLCQIICLTIAPAFIMGGIYYLLAQLLVCHTSSSRSEYSLIKPLWFTYIFVFCDVLSLVIQAIGGGIAAVSLETNDSTDNGTHIMVAGIAYQVFSMSLFLFLLFHFLFKIFFRANPEIKFSISNLFALFFNTKNGKELRAKLDPYYNSHYQEVRSRKVFGYFPIILLLSVIFIYIRCIYRVVELAQGWTGYLITHEAFVMTLDAMMIFFTTLTYIPFHPGIIFGRNTNLSLKVIKKRLDLEEIDHEHETTGNETTLNEHENTLNEKTSNHEDFNSSGHTAL